MADMIAEYTNRIASANPSEALQIALAEVERQKLAAQQAAQEYKMLSEIEFDASGRITRANMAGLYRLAQIYASSTIVPAQFQSTTAASKVSECFIACQMAFRLKVDPFAYMQASYVVHGRPGIEAKLAIAMLNTSGKIKGRIRYKDQIDPKGKILGCTAFATDAESGEEVFMEITWDIVEAEGWHTKSGSKWKTIPKLMFRYRAAAWLIKTYFPEVIMGMDFADEVDDAEPVRAKLTPLSTDELVDRVKAAANGHAKQEEAKTPEPAKPEPSEQFPDEAPVNADTQRRLSEAMNKAKIAWLQVKKDARFRELTQYAAHADELTQQAAEVLIERLEGN